MGNKELLEIIFRKLDEKPTDINIASDVFSVIRHIHDEDSIAQAHDGCCRLRRKIVTTILSSEDADLQWQFHELYNNCLLLDAPHYLDEYILYIESKREPAKEFYQPRRKVMLPIVRDMQALFDGEIDFLGVSLPTRTGKSTLGIMFMTWIMGNRPEIANVMSGHSDKLTDGFFREVLTILTDTETYRWSEVFPGVQIVDTSTKNETIDLLRKKRFPTFTARSIGGTLTGAVEIGSGGCLYVDDLVEDLEEAMNPERLKNKYDAYLNQLKDRKKEGAFELMVGTRWNVFDPLGRVAEQYGDNPRYRFRVIPALNEKGESNFDYPYGLGFSTKYYLDMKATIDDSVWMAKYMGNPYIREGLLYNRQDLRRYYELPQEQPDMILGVCDTAEGGGDDTVLPVMYVYGQDHYLVDCVCSSALPEVTDELCAAILLKHQVKLCRFESNSAGGRTADKVQEKITKKSGVTHITKKRTTASKATKILVNSPWVKEHCLFLDDSRIAPGSGYQRFMTALCLYTISGKNKHDDVPDALAQYAEFVQSLSASSVTVIKRPF